MSNIKHTLYTFEDKTSDEVLLINGFQHINQLIPYVNELQQEKQQLEKRIKKALDFIDSKVISNGEIIDQLRKIEVKELIEILNGKSDE